METPKNIKTGMEVNITSEGMGKDPWAYKMVREVGDTISKGEQQRGMKYVGSVAMHILIEDTSGLAKPQTRISVITQDATNHDLSQAAVALAFNKAQLDLIRIWNPNAKSGKRNDRR